MWDALSDERTGLSYARVIVSSSKSVVSVCNLQLKRPSLSFYNPSAQTTQKAVSIVDKACLMIRCLALDVMLRTYASAGMCLLSRCLAMDLCHSIYNMYFNFFR
jgi:hypothetical protein